jgi:hypothetical protein
VAMQNREGCQSLAGIGNLDLTARIRTWNHSGLVAVVNKRLVNPTFVTYPKVDSLCTSRLMQPLFCAASRESSC